MPPSDTVLEFLTRPNPTIIQLRGTGGSNTTHPRWDPIEGVRRLNGFNYSNCYQTYKLDLKKTFPPLDLQKLVSRAQMNQIMNEDTIVPLAAICNVFPVNLALAKTIKDLHMAPGSIFSMKHEDGKPDWGVGDDQVNDMDQALLNYCPGDSKLSSKWTSEGLLDSNLNVKDPDPQLRNQLRPLEQIQHYCRSLGTPWGFILTDKEAVICRINGSTANRQSPRPIRETSHQRGPSNASTLSSDISNMSLDGSVYSSNSLGLSLGPIEIVSIPWSAEGEKKMTVNLALYYLARLSHREDQISDSYPSLDPKATESAPSKGLTIATPTSSRSKTGLSKPKAAGKDGSKKIFIPGQGVHLQVISADIPIYIPGAGVEEGEHERVKGYFIKYQDPENVSFPEFLKFLRRDTEAWLHENVAKYIDSATYKRRGDFGTENL